MSVVGLIFDIVTLAALAATIFFSLRLSRQFEQLRADRAAFEKLIGTLDSAIDRTDTSLTALKETAIKSGDQLQEKINSARALTDELEIIIQAGDNLAERLSSRATQSQTAPAVAEKTAIRDETAPKARTRAEQELMDAIKARQNS